MNNLLIDIRKKLRYGLALLLFLGILIGGSAAALSILAAGISAISSPKYTAVSSTRAAPRSTVVDQEQTSQPNTTTDTYVTSPSAPTSGVATEDFSQRLNDQIDRMHSPIGDAIDNGGVSLGDHVQTWFGNVLSGILKSLFLEQPDRNPGKVMSNANGGRGNE